MVHASCVTVPIQVAVLSVRPPVGAGRTGALAGSQTDAAPGWPQGFSKLTEIRPAERDSLDGPVTQAYSSALLAFRAVASFVSVTRLANVVPSVSCAQLTLTVARPSGAA